MASGWQRSFLFIHLFTGGIVQNDEFEKNYLALTQSFQIFQATLAQVTGGLETEPRDDQRSGQCTDQTVDQLADANQPTQVAVADLATGVDVEELHRMNLSCWMS